MSLNSTAGLTPVALGLAALGLLGALPASAQTTVTYTDNAANSAYAAPPNTSTDYNGKNGNPSGFGAFNDNSVNGAGTFIASASESEAGNNNPGSIDSNGVSFGSYTGGNPTGSTTITRSFTQSLQNNGDAFSLDFVTGYNDGANGTGASGVELLSGATPVGSFFYQSNDQYLFNGAQVTKADGTKQDFVSGPLHFTYDITSPTTYSFTSTGAVSYTSTGTFSAPITGFEVQQTNSNGGDPGHNAYFNNLSVTNATASAAPEPGAASVFLIAAVLLGGTLAMRRRRTSLEQG